MTEVARFRQMIDGTRDHMLGEDNLEADKYPYVRVRSLAIAGESPRFAARIEVELHGQKRERGREDDPDVHGRELCHRRRGPRPLLSCDDLKGGRNEK